MNTWNQLKITRNLDDFTDKELHVLVCNRLGLFDPYWIVYNDTSSLTYKVYDSLHEMAVDFWSNWSSRYLSSFIENCEVDNELPIIRTGHAREFYLMKDRDLAKKFLEELVKVIQNNAIEKDEGITGTSELDDFRRLDFDEPWIEDSEGKHVPRYEVGSIFTKNEM
jgi:hypothetical protein